MVMASVWIYFRDAEGEEGEREELEDFGFGHGGCERGEERILFAGGSVGGGLDSTEGALYWWGGVSDVVEKRGGRKRTSEHVLALPV